MSRERWTVTSKWVVRESADLPAQVTFEAVPMFVYPVLHVHTTALLLASCEQSAFTSHAPLLTLQLSRIDKDNREVMWWPRWLWRLPLTNLCRPHSRWSQCSNIRSCSYTLLHCCLHRGSNWHLNRIHHWTLDRHLQRWDWGAMQKPVAGMTRTDDGYLCKRRWWVNRCSNSQFCRNIGLHSLSSHANKSHSDHIYHCSPDRCLRRSDK